MELLKTVNYLSPSSIGAFENLDEFVKRYIVTPRPPFIQSAPMAIGSGFDAFVKNELARCIYGGSVVTLGQPYHLETLFKKQVQSEEDHEWCWNEAGHLFLNYKDHGAFDELLIDLEGHKELEFEVPMTTTVKMVDGKEVPFKGIPDCIYRHRNGKLVILDWKCNGFRSSKKSSPYKYYVKERPNGRSHSDVAPEAINEIFMQDKYCFSETNEKWASQLAIYGWLRGEPIGEPFVAQIEQILIDPGDSKPESRSVTYRSYISPEYQFELSKKISNIWDIVQSGHIYQNLTREENDSKIQALAKYNAMASSNNPIMSIIKGAK